MLHFPEFPIDHLLFSLFGPLQLTLLCTTCGQSPLRSPTFQPLLLLSCISALSNLSFSDMAYVYHITFCFVCQYNNLFCRILFVSHREKGEQIVYRRLRDMREDKDLLQKDLAAYLQCSQVCYSHYEIGKRDIPTEVLIKLANFYETSVDYLLEITDTSIPYPRKN